MTPAPNPWIAVAGQFAEGLGSSLATSPAGPSSVRADSLFDSSGWNVNFGAGTITSDRNQREGANTFDQYVPYVIAAAGVLIVWRLTRKR